MLGAEGAALEQLISGTCNLEREAVPAVPPLGSAKSAEHWVLTELESLETWSDPLDHGIWHCTQQCTEVGLFHRVLGRHRVLSAQENLMSPPGRVQP